MGLSARNGWYDDAGRVYIFYTLDEIQEDLNCGHEKAVKLLSELDTDKGCGLIERVKQGQGRPTKIYVKRFTTRQITAEPLAPQETPRLPKIGSQEVGKTEVKSSDNPKSRLPFFRSADFGKSDGNYILEASNPVPTPLLGHRCRSSQEITGSPTPFSTSNHYLWIWLSASFSLSNPNIAA